MGGALRLPTPTMRVDNVRLMASTRDLSAVASFSAPTPVVLLPPLRQILASHSSSGDATGLEAFVGRRGKAPTHATTGSAYSRPAAPMTSSACALLVGGYRSRSFCSFRVCSIISETLSP